MICNISLYTCNGPGGAAQRRSFSAKLGVGPEHLGPLLRSVWSVKFVVRRLLLLEDGLQFQVRGNLGTVVHNGALCCPHDGRAAQHYYTR